MNILREPDPQRTINRPFGPRRMDVRTRGARVAQRLVALLETSFCPSPRGRARRADGDIALSPCLPPASAGRELLFVSRHTFGHIDDATASQLLFDSMINRWRVASSPACFILYSWQIGKKIFHKTHFFLVSRGSSKQNYQGGPKIFYKISKINNFCLLVNDQPKNKIA